jgi:hypothetical protein
MTNKSRRRRGIGKKKISTIAGGCWRGFSVFFGESFFWCYFFFNLWIWGRGKMTLIRTRSNTKLAGAYISTRASTRENRITKLIREETRVKKISSRRPARRWGLQGHLYTRVAHLWPLQESLLPFGLVELSTCTDVANAFACIVVAFPLACLF